MHHFLMQNKIIADEEQGNIQQGIATPTGSIAKGLQGHKLSEWCVKPINDSM